MDLSVVIVSWNTRDDLARCLQSLRPPAESLALEVVVVDNGSTDGSPAMVRQRFPEVRLLRRQENRGFAAGNNVGLATTTGRYDLLLNPDCIVHDGALERLVAAADQAPDIGLLGPRLVYGDGALQASCRRFPTVGALLFRNTPLGKLFPRNPWSASYLMENWDHHRPREVDWLSGAALLVRRDVWHDIGRLDERYFMYVEDMDLCYRAHRAGWRVVYEPSATITHLVGRSSDRRPLAMVREHHISMAKYLRKHYGDLAAALAMPLLLARYLAIVTRARLG